MIEKWSFSAILHAYEENVEYREASRRNVFTTLKLKERCIHFQSLELNGRKQFEICGIQFQINTFTQTINWLLAMQIV